MWMPILCKHFQWFLLSFNEFWQFSSRQHSIVLEIRFQIHGTRSWIQIPAVITAKLHCHANCLKSRSFVSVAICWATRFARTFLSFHLDGWTIFDFFMIGKIRNNVKSAKNSKKYTVTVDIFMPKNYWTAKCPLKDAVQSLPAKQSTFVHRQLHLTSSIFISSRQPLITLLLNSIKEKYSRTQWIISIFSINLQHLKVNVLRLMKNIVLQSIEALLNQTIQLREKNLQKTFDNSYFL